MDAVELKATCDALGTGKRDRQILRLYYVEARETAAIAREVAVPQARVQTVIGRFRRRLAGARREAEATPEPILMPEPEPGAAPEPEEPDADDDGPLSLKQEARVLLASMRGHGKSRPPLETVDRFGRSIGLHPSPLVSADWLADYLRDVGEDRAERERCPTLVRELSAEEMERERARLVKRGYVRE